MAFRSFFGCYTLGFIVYAHPHVNTCTSASQRNKLSNHDSLKSLLLWQGESVQSVLTAVAQLFGLQVYMSYKNTTKPINLVYRVTANCNQDMYIYIYTHMGACINHCHFKSLQCNSLKIAFLDGFQVLFWLLHFRVHSLCTRPYVLIEIGLPRTQPCFQRKDIGTFYRYIDRQIDRQIDTHAQKHTHTYIYIYIYIYMYLHV